MEPTDINVQLPLSFNQVVDIVIQLPDSEKQKLSELLKKESTAKSNAGKDEILTHFASENVLAKDWLSPEEDEAWKNL